jgi:hypothetical protein
MGLVATVALLGWPRLAAASGGEGMVAWMVNDARGGQGLATLANDASLAAIAESHSAQMAQSGTIFHNSGLPGDVGSSGLRWSVVGENVGLGADVGHVEDAFMQSPEHYRNIMDARFNAIGVGVASDGAGHVFVTQVFAEIVSAAAAPATTNPTTAAPTVAADVPAVPASSDEQSAPAPVAQHEFAAREGVETRSSPPRVPAGWVRAEDGSLVPATFYACAGEQWVGSVATTGSVANSPSVSASC